MRLATGTLTSSSTISTAKVMTTPFSRRLMKLVTVGSISRASPPCTRCTISGPMSLAPTRPQASMAMRLMLSSLSNQGRRAALYCGGRGSASSAKYRPTDHTSTGRGFAKPRTKMNSTFLMRFSDFATSQGHTL